jgi:hypothetical protein
LGKKLIPAIGFRLVYVEWVDSCGAIARWQYLDESAPEYIRCHSIGWLVYDGKDCKRLVPHVGQHTGDDSRKQGCGDMTIPTPAIVRMVDVGIAEPSIKKG